MNNDNFDDEDDYWPEGVSEDSGWVESCRDWIGSNDLDGIEGTMGITVSFFGHTKEQAELIQSVMLDFGTEARELFQRLIDNKMAN
jgi:hypothetical protein